MTETLRYSCARGLERAGHHVTVCSSAAAALGTLRHSSFDLITVDHCFVGMSGFGFLRALKHDGIDTPAIMITYDEDLSAQAILAGAIDFLVIDRELSFLTELPERVSNSVMRFRSC